MGLLIGHTSLKIITSILVMTKRYNAVDSKTFKLCLTTNCNKYSIFQETDFVEFYAVPYNYQVFCVICVAKF